MCALSIGHRLMAVFLGDISNGHPAQLIDFYIFHDIASVDTGARLLRPSRMSSRNNMKVNSHPMYVRLCVCVCMFAGERLGRTCLAHFVE